MRWRLYYWTPERGAFVITDAEATWAEAPEHGVQVRAYEQGGRWTLSHGQEEPYDLPGHREVKHGALAPDSEYEAIHAQAYADVGAVI